MKLFIQAAVGSIAIHVMYLLCMFLIGYIKTMNYTPDIENSWKSVDTLQNEVAFGMTTSPFFFIFTFIGAALICGIVIVFYVIPFPLSSLTGFELFSCDNLRLF